MPEGALQGAPLPIEDRDWLAVGADEPTNPHWFICRSESEVGARIKELVEGSRRVPDYFGVGVELAGKKVTRFAPDLRLWHEEA